tara:strand:- start:8 stop:151 length:144 start_codon:yes stop_codon:yes gene_type:complete
MEKINFDKFIDIVGKGYEELFAVKGVVPLSDKDVSVNRPVFARDSIT